MSQRGQHPFIEQPPNANSAKHAGPSQELGACDEFSLSQTTAITALTKFNQILLLFKIFPKVN
jgi:hypothetical protein